jgi:hypothetical protein
MKLPVLAVAFATLASSQQPRWFKGNTHMHSTRSDGDSPLNTTARWYHDNGYDYIVPTDHRVFTLDADISIPNRRKDFLIIQGEEFHSNTGYGDNHSTIVNASGALGDIAAGSASLSQHFNRIFALAASKQGLPFINHPTWSNLVPADEFLRIQGYRHFEIFNGAQDTDNYGMFGTGMPPIEALWDSILTRGGKFYGVGSDDLHTFTPRPGTSNPMTGFTMLKAPRLGVQEVLDAYRKGDFYATNGVMLKDISSTLGLYKVAVDPVRTSAELTRRDTSRLANPARPVKTGNPGFRIDFIGPGGKILKAVAGDSASFQATNDIAYVRCRITYLRAHTAASAPYDNRLKQADYVKANAIAKEEYYAWGQPYFTDARREGPPLIFGCMDPAYFEYDEKANVAQPGACKNRNTGIRIHPGGDGRPGLTVEVAPELGRYELALQGLNGKLIRREAGNASRRHTLDGLAAHGTYIVALRGERKILRKRLTLP